MTTPDPSLAHERVLARLAWCGWPDNEASRKLIAEQEARDPLSACAWDRVIKALTQPLIDQLDDMTGQLSDASLS